MDFLDLVKFALICFDSLAWPLFALGYPLHASIQAIETNSDIDTKKLITYWIVFSLISLFEHAFLGILQWLPFWPYLKLMVVGWTMIPQFDGAFYVYNHFVHPCVYVDLPTITVWCKKLQLFFLHNFLADECVKVDGSPEVLEKLVANRPKGTEPAASILPADIKPVLVTEKREVAPANPILKTEPNVVKTVSDTVMLPEIAGETGCDRTEIPLDKQVQKEWTCAMCQVKVSSEETLKMHLQGRKHKNACEMLTKAKSQPCKGKAGSDSVVKKPSKDGSSYKAENPKTETSKHMPTEKPKKSVQATNVAKNRVNSSKNVQGQQHVGKQQDVTKVAQFRCTICNATCTRFEDLNRHLRGKRHLEQIQKLSEGQTSNSSSVPPKTDTSKCYMPVEGSKKSVPATNMVENQVKPVAGRQQVRKEHDETNIYRFRCTICNVSCTGLEDFNCHLWGRKHVAQLQQLNNL